MISSQALDPCSPATLETRIRLPAGVISSAIVECWEHDLDHCGPVVLAPGSRCASNDYTQKFHGRNKKTDTGRDKLMNERTILVNYHVIVNLILLEMVYLASNVKSIDIISNIYKKYYQVFHFWGSDSQSWSGTWPKDHKDSHEGRAYYHDKPYIQTRPSQAKEKKFQKMPLESDIQMNKCGSLVLINTTFIFATRLVHSSRVIRDLSATAFCR